MSATQSRLDELLDDPMVQLVMQRDRVNPKGLRWMLERARARIEDPSLPPAYMVARDCCEQNIGC
ncbi:hypothetical protein QEZ48_20120 [Aquamicrobium lusatiense]|uniref:hypothetical protein n=1 Tax=Aquamicrobium TaxID=69278 RepID=UPI002453CDC6|nr:MULTISPECIES: hypothetical protein [Aquamicrobium]MCK9552345.1 hypothetical protein [Aquamicrobium sp.]MDH4993126.1 hypothetical protein [Aquamicrobium lusatiense]